MTPPSRQTWLLFGLWGLLMAAALSIRPPLPVDETRYLAVAWEMWRDGQFLVPHLNGETYAHKPPLLFWLMQLGWAVFGVNDWWPRLVAPLFGLGSLLLTAALARDLWPERPEVAESAPLLLLGALFWTLFTTLTMFDMMLAFFALLGVRGLHRAARGQGGRWGFSLFALSMGLGLLAKGPAIFLHLLPVAVAAPWWAGPELARGRWYGGVALATLAAAILALAWAVPAGHVGGEAYRDAIFWGQSAGRMVDSFAHARPWWFFLGVLPAMLLPWTAWPRLWRGLLGLRALSSDGAVRLCLVWLLSALLAFSLISGKQLHYLLPEMPALAMLFALAVLAGGGPRGWADRLPGAVIALAGAAMVAAPHIGRPPLDGAGGLWGLAVAAAGILLAWRPGDTPAQQIKALAGAGAVLVVALHLALAPVLAGYFDLRTLALEIGAWQRAGLRVAHYGKDHGTFTFLGRLSHPLDPVGDQEVVAWVRQNPGGRIVTYQKQIPGGAKPVFVQPYGRRLITVWAAADVLANPDLPRRP